MFKEGRLVMKIAGRDAGKVGVVLDLDLKNNKALVDGMLRRRSVNLNHLEPINNEIKLSSKDHEVVLKELEKLGYNKPKAHRVKKDKKSETQVKSTKKTNKKSTSKKEK